MLLSDLPRSEGEGPALSIFGLLPVCAFLVSRTRAQLVFCAVFLLCLPGDTDGASAPSAAPTPGPGPRAADRAPAGVPFCWCREPWRPGS